MNWKQLTYKQRNKALVLGSIGFLIIAWLLSISKTMNLYFERNDLEVQLQQAQHAPANIKHYEEKLSVYNKKIGAYAQDSLINQEYALEVISEFCKENNLVLRTFPDARVSEEKGFNLKTNIAEAEGDFIGLLKLVYHLETKKTVGRITSVHFNAYKDRNTRRRVLTVEIYFQNIKIKDEEDTVV